MAKKKTVTIKKYDLNPDEQKVIIAMRAVVKAREAKKALDVANDKFEEIIDDFKYPSDDDSFYSDDYL